MAFDLPCLNNGQFGADVFHFFLALLHYMDFKVQCSTQLMKRLHIPRGRAKHSGRPKWHSNIGRTLKIIERLRLMCVVVSYTSPNKKISSACRCVTNSLASRTPELHETTIVLVVMLS